MVFDLEDPERQAQEMKIVRAGSAQREGALTFSQQQVAQCRDFFEVLATTDRTQLAVMTLQQGQTSGEFGTDHPDSDQLFYVLEGVGQLVLESGDVEVHPGDTGVVEAGAKHQFIGKSEHVFRTLNVYGPVAYPDEA